MVGGRADSDGTEGNSGSGNIGLGTGENSTGTAGGRADGVGGVNGEGKGWIDSGSDTDSFDKSNFTLSIGFYGGTSGIGVTDIKSIEIGISFNGIAYTFGGIDELVGVTDDDSAGTGSGVGFTSPKSTLDDMIVTGDGRSAGGDGGGGTDRGSGTPRTGDITGGENIGSSGAKIKTFLVRNTVVVGLICAVSGFDKKLPNTASNI